MSASSAVLTSASNPFVCTDVGKSIIVAKAGGSSGFAPLSATISSFQSAGQVTLSATATLAVSGAGAIYGTDDTTAIQNAVNAAVTYASNNFGAAEVLFAGGIYCIAGAPVSGGVSVTNGALNLGNAQIQLPYIDTASGRQKVSLSLRGLAGHPSPPPHWNQTTLVTDGAVLACMRTDGAYNATYGPTSVIGSPVDTGGLFSNLRAAIDNLSILLPYESTYCGVDLFGCGQMDLGRLSVTCMATPPSGTPWPQYENWGPANVAQASNMFALRSPALGNNDQSALYDLTAYGMACGVMFTDHLSASNVRCVYCINAIQAIASASNDSHLCYFANLSAELCQTWIAANNSGGYACNAPTPLIVNAHFEHVAGGSVGVYDPGNKLYGQVSFENLGGIYSGYTFNLLTGAANIKLVLLHNGPGPVSSPAAAPGNNVAWPNYYYRDAEITLSVSAGSLSALTINGVAQTVPAGTTFYRFTLPSGQSYTPTYTGTLTHTVTLF